MFKVTALPFDGTKNRRRKVNYKEDFFGKRPTYGFGQLEGETLRWLWVRFILLDQI
jgi:hypothetical protein